MKPYEQVPWATVEKLMLTTWKQGEHVCVNGPTGVGKTTLISRILPARRYVVMLVTKVHDNTITKEFKDFEVIEKWPPRFHQERVLLWPKPGKTIRDTMKRQHDVFQEALDRIFQDRNWCVVTDEQHYVCKDLNLERENTMFQHQGRSSGLSCVNGAQRPAWVPLITMSGSTHYFLWKNTLQADLKRLSDIGGIDRNELEAQLRTLDKHEFVYINSRTGLTVRSQVER